MISIALYTPPTANHNRFIAPVNFNFNSTLLAFTTTPTESAQVFRHKTEHSNIYGIMFNKNGMLSVKCGIASIKSGILSVKRGITPVESGIVSVKRGTTSGTNGMTSLKDGIVINLLNF